MANKEPERNASAHCSCAEMQYDTSAQANRYIFKSVKLNESAFMINKKTALYNDITQLIQKNVLEEIRTLDHTLRRRELYPAELPGQHCYSTKGEQRLQAEINSAPGVPQSFFHPE